MYLSLVKALFGIISSIASYLERKQLIDVGRADAIREVLDEKIDNIRKADAARRAANDDDADGVLDDPNNRDN